MSIAPARGLGRATLLGFTLAGLTASWPGFASEDLAPLLACRALADPSARLACFDRESANLGRAAAASAPPARVVPTAPPMSAAAPPPAAASSPAPAVPPASGIAERASTATPGSLKADFGLSNAALTKREVAAGTRPADLNSIDAHVAAVSSSGTGVATFTLDNGQVWRELTPDGDLLAKPGDAVTVSRGVFHSYWLQVKNGRGSKVTRIL